MYVCTRCKATDNAHNKPARCARCCYWGVMLDERLLRLRQRHLRKRAVGSADEFIDDDYLNDEFEEEFEEDEDNEPAQAVSLSSAEEEEFEHVPTGQPSLDEALSGGFVKGFVHTLAGDEGAGKSTLILQLKKWAKLKTRIATAEETLKYWKQRAERVKVSPRGIRIIETDDILEALDTDDDFDLLVIDSIQTFQHQECDGQPGSNVQMIAVMKEIQKVTRERDCISVVLAMVNKKRAFAGPNAVRHMGDVNMRLLVRNAEDEEPNPKLTPRRDLHIDKHRDGKSKIRCECRMTPRGLLFD